MSTTLRATSQTLEENPAAGEGKAKATLAQGKRRALGDIGNLVPAAKAQGKQKDAWGAAKPKAAGAATKPAAKEDATALNRVPTRVVTRAQARQQGASLSSLLNTISAQAASARKPSSKQAPPSPLPDIDSGDKKNHLAETEYINDIFCYYWKAEPRYRVSPEYMVSQTDINEKMRAILVDWLVEVHLKFKLMPETLFLTANLIDRYLEAKPVTRKNLQLVGVTAMLIGSKYEEIWAPEVRDFVYISDKAYNRDQILGMEKEMLNTLRFDLTLPTPYNFLGRFLKAASCQFDKQVSMLANYVVELALVDYPMLKYSYSMLSAAAVLVALTAFDHVDCFPKALAKHSRYARAAVLPCARDLVALMKAAPDASLTAVFKKYSTPKFLETAKVEPPLALLDEGI